MSDYIKREDVINIINYWWGDSIAQWLVKKIKNVPSVDVAPVRHGHWVEDEVQIHVEKTYHCSECDCLAWGEDKKTRYCPTCGARMDEVKKKMMTDYIKREDAIEWFQGMMDYDGSDYDIGVGGCIAAVKRRIPSADVAPVRHGHWIKISPAGIYECSECGKDVMTSDIEAYVWCHGCGARMDGEVIKNE